MLASAAVIDDALTDEDTQNKTIIIDAMWNRLQKHRLFPISSSWSYLFWIILSSLLSSTKKERGRRHKRSSTKPSASTRRSLMVCQFEVYESFVRALSDLCICIVIKFSSIIMQLLPFRFKDTLAHHLDATRVINQYLGWNSIALGFLDKHNNRWQEKRTDWCVAVFGDLGWMLFLIGDNVALISDIILMVSSYSRHLRTCLRSEELSGLCFLCQSSMLPSVLTRGD